VISQNTPLITSAIKMTIFLLAPLKMKNSMALVLSFLPNTTYDLPAFDLLLESGPQICGVPVDDLSLGVA
jgi:hypothetical protein